MKTSELKKLVAKNTVFFDFGVNLALINKLKEISFIQQGKFP